MLFLEHFILFFSCKIPGFSSQQKLEKLVQKSFTLLSFTYKTMMDMELYCRGKFFFFLIKFNHYSSVCEPTLFVDPQLLCHTDLILQLRYMSTLLLQRTFAHGIRRPQPPRWTHPSPCHHCCGQLPELITSRKGSLNNNNKAYNHGKSYSWKASQEMIAEIQNLDPVVWYFFQLQMPTLGFSNFVIQL